MKGLVNSVSLVNLNQAGHKPRCTKLEAPFGAHCGLQAERGSRLRSYEMSSLLLHCRADSPSAEPNAKYLHLEVSHGNPGIELYRRSGSVDHQRYLMTKRLGD